MNDCGEAMRRSLVDRARRKRAERHGGGQQRVELNGLDVSIEDQDDRVIAVSEASSRGS